VCCLVISFIFWVFLLLLPLKSFTLTGPLCKCMYFILATRANKHISIYGTDLSPTREGPKNNCSVVGHNGGSANVITDVKLEGRTTQIN